jgi:hypothetical protein
MATQTQHSYPIFEKNQVLTHSQLNQLTSWLEEQGRLTRTGLIGIGIVCGFRLKFVPGSAPSVSKDTLFLSEGTGVTSEGHLITLCDCEITKLRPYELNEYVDYRPFQHPDTGEQDIEFRELLSDDFNGDSSEVENLKESDLNNKVVLLFIEMFDKNLKSCLSQGCDEIGVERRMNIRKLLISKSDLNKVKNRTNGGKADPFIEGSNELPAIHIKRPVLSANSPGTLSYAGMAMEYISPVKEVWEVIFDALNKSYKVYEPVLGSLYGDNPFESDPVIQKKEAIEDYIRSFEEMTSLPYGIQYLYGFVKDLLMAYEEFRVAGYELRGICCPDRSRFPAHLMLGEPLAGEPALCDPMEFRHSFTPSPILTDRHEYAEKLKMLHKRLVLMIESLQVERIDQQGKWDLKVTPSVEKQGKLAGRSIPVYYDSKSHSTFDNLGTLEESWDYDLQRQCRSNGNIYQLSYDNHGMAAEQSPVNTPLNYDLDPFTFLRIEGHLGKEVDEAEKLLGEIRQEYNLSFDIKTIFFGDEVQSGKMPGCLLKDLQPRYSIWRNRILLFAKNLVKTSETAENVFHRMRAESDVPVSSMFAARTAESFRPSGAFNIHMADFGNLFAARESKEFVDSSNRIYEFMKRLDDAGRESGEREADGPREEDIKDEEVHDQFTSFNDCLHGLIQSLPVKFEDFDIQEWLRHYKCLLRVFVDVMKMMAKNTGTEQIQIAFAVIFLIILTAIFGLVTTLSFYPFITIRVLTDTAKSRRDLWSESFRVSGFRKKNPGLEHKAGVAPGQTFVLVYQTSHNFDKPESEGQDIFPSGLKLDDPEKYNDLIQAFQNKVVADFTLPFICCDECNDTEAEGEKLRPFAPPLAAVAMPENIQENIEYRSVEIQLMNNLFDPDLFEPEVIGEPKYGAVDYRKDIYEPDPSKKKTILIYQVDPKAVSDAKNNTRDSFLIDEFEYRILDLKGDEVDRDQITIFIPLFREQEQQPAVVHGHVSEDFSGNRPIVGANVIVVGEQLGTITDANGNYNLQNVPTGNQTLRVSIAGFKTQSKTIDVRPGNQRLDFRLEFDIIIEVDFSRYFDAMELAVDSEAALSATRHHEAIFKEANMKAIELAREETSDDSPVRKTADTIREFTSTPDLSVVRLNNEYEKRKEELIQAIQESDGDEKEKYTEALDNLTTVYLDRVSIIQPDGFTASTEKVVEGIATLTTEQPELKLNETVLRWQNDSSDFLSVNVKNNLAGRFGR